MNRTSIALQAVLTLGLVAMPSFAQTPATAKPQPDAFVQRGTHDHGKVTVNLAVEGGTLSAELDSPAINVIGFERAPRDATEKAAVAATDRWLGSGVGVLGVPTAAGCQRSGVEYTAPTLVGDDHDAAHEKAHEHEDEHQGEGGHADYEARFTYTCANPAALDWVELRLLGRLKDVKQVQVNLVTPQKQTQLSVTGAAPRVSLR